MSELKDLSWAVQESVEPLPFEQLERRGVRRRRRRQALAGAGAAAAATLAVLAVLLPFEAKTGTEKPPVATVPTAPVSLLPSPTIDRAAQALANDKGAMLVATTTITPARWSATWMKCPTEQCNFAAVLSRDGQKAFAPVRKSGYVTLQAGDEAIAVAGPTGTPFSAADRSWSDTLLVRWTADGLSKTKLHWAEPTNSFRSDEILTDQFGELLVLNPANSSLRKLEWQADEYASSPVRDSTGRWWLVKGQSGDSTDSYIAWTDDGGKTWDQTLLDPDNGASYVAVSQDGQTIVASSGGDGSTPEAIIKLKMSTDRGATWRPVTNLPWGRAGGPVAFDDHTAVLLGQQDSANPALSLYSIIGGAAKKLDSAPPNLLEGLTGDGRALYSTKVESPTTKVATSPDRGKTWTTFEPR